MNSNSERRAGTPDNCAAIAADDLGILGLVIDDGPVRLEAFLNALSKHCRLVSVKFPPGVTVADFWHRNRAGKFLLVYSNPPHADGSEASCHISALVNGTVRNTTELLLRQPLVAVHQVLSESRPKVLQAIKLRYGSSSLSLLHFLSQK